MGSGGVRGVANARQSPIAFLKRDHREARSVNLIFFLLIGLAAGWLAGQLVKRRGSGWVEDLIIGVIGALIGGFLFGLLGVHVGGLIGQLISATVGAVILLFLMRYIRRI
jgi:uncharacterized membrane protein YeaQ/YmgE (transglycosylase-associated protein family)